MRVIRTGIAVAVLLGIVVVAPPAGASSYEGWGDTGWTQYNKRDCCDLAVEYAFQNSIDICMDTGGRPRARAGRRRGSCEWEMMQDGYGDTVFRCYSNTSVSCRN